MAVFVVQVLTSNGLHVVAARQPAQRTLTHWDIDLQCHHYFPTRSFWVVFTSHTNPTRLSFSLFPVSLDIWLSSSWHCAVNLYSGFVWVSVYLDFIVTVSELQRSLTEKPDSRQMVSRSKYILVSSKPSWSSGMEYWVRYVSLTNLNIAYACLCNTCIKLQYECTACYDCVVVVVPFNPFKLRCGQYGCFGNQM